MLLKISLASEEVTQPLIFLSLQHGTGPCYVNPYNIHTLRSITVEFKEQDIHVEVTVTIYNSS